MKELEMSVGLEEKLSRQQTCGNEEIDEAMLETVTGGCMGSWVKHLPDILFDPTKRRRRRPKWPRRPR